MDRTPGDISRRRALADAAGGFTARATVVLYACIASVQDEGDVLARLRRHAEARDWVVVGEVIDHDTTGTPLECRRNWAQAKAFVTTGQARGIVATPGTERAGVASPSLTQWLHDHQAFLFEESPAGAGVVR
ncbi:hypothetical protein [Streptomyces sp. NPDC096152]|uniref:hypothetical protein n=1 Tax=Streptomyces sp. NPDC096152 TaxID=3366078 RepID=UPI00381FF475